MPVVYSTGLVISVVTSPFLFFAAAKIREAHDINLQCNFPLFELQTIRLTEVCLLLKFMTNCQIHLAFLEAKVDTESLKFKWFIFPLMHDKFKHVTA